MRLIERYNIHSLGQIAKRLLAPRMATTQRVGQRLLFLVRPSIRHEVRIPPRAFAVLHALRLGRSQLKDSVAISPGPRAMVTTVAQTDRAATLYLSDAMRYTNTMAFRFRNRTSGEFRSFRSVPII